MGEARSHREHSQDAPACLQPLVLCGCARDSQCFLQEMLLHSVLELAAQGVVFGMNVRFLKKASFQVGFLQKTSFQVGFFPPMLGGRGQQPCTAATVLISCSAPIPLGSFFHLLAALIFGCSSDLGF